MPLRLEAMSPAAVFAEYGISRLSLPACWRAIHTNLLLKGRKDLRGIIVPDKAEDAGGLTPGKDDNAVWRNKTRKAFDDLIED